MRCLVVLAHPQGKSLNRHFAEVAVGTLKAAGHEVTTIDLYADGFDPRLSEAERASYYLPKYDDGVNGQSAAALRDAELLVFVFPTWWFGPPAILKGWIDRVFAPGVAFDHGKNFGPIVPLLTNLKRAVVVTTLGTPWWVDRFVMFRPVRRMFKTAVLGACAPKAHFSYLPLYAAENPEPKRVSAFEARIRRVLVR